MKTFSPFKILKKGSWSEDFAPILDVRQQMMFVQCAGQYIATDKYVLNERSNLHSYLIMYTVDGTGILEYKGQKYALTKGNCVLLNCEEKHNYWTAPGCEWNIKWLHFAGSEITGYLNIIFDNWGVFTLEKCDEMIDDIYRLTKNGDMLSLIDASTRLIGACSQIAISLLKSNNNIGIQQSPLVKSAKSYIDEHFTEKLTLDALCETLGASKFYLSHLFKEQTGKGPYEYLIEVRLKFAKSLLRSTTESINKIAELCGFSSSSHFIKIFKQQEGITPLKFREYFITLNNE